MSLYSDDRRKRKWDNTESSPTKSRSSGRDHDSHEKDYDRDRERHRDGDRESRDRDRDRDRDRERDKDRDKDRDRDKYDDRRASHSSRERESRHSGDRRSVSPRVRDSQRSSSSRSSAPMDPAAAAAAAAARIAADLDKRNAVPPTIPNNYGQGQPPPPPSSNPMAITAPPPPPPPSGLPVPPPPSHAAAPPPPSISVVVKKDERGPLGDVYQQDGDWMKDIEINNLRNRYLLTKAATQQQIKRDSGADVTTKGKYYPDLTLATERDPPLYLHITAKTYPQLEKASRMIEEMINRDLGSLVDERRFRRTDERDEFGRRKWPEEKIPIGMESVRGFNVRAQIVGPSGSYVKHISTETRTRVQIKGQNSGFVEPSLGRESDEPTYLHITGPDEVEVQKAKAMALDLISTVRQAYEAHRTGQPTPSAPAPPPQPPQNQLVAPGVNAPPGTSYPGAPDPYAAYSGYQSFNYSSYYGQQSPPAPGAPGAGSPPPPPGVSGNGYPAPPNVISPPPPPGASSYGGGQYSSMPPPPGM